MTAFVLLAFAVAVEPTSAQPLARLGGGVFAHPDHPLALAVSPDGTRILTGGADGLLRMWDAQTGLPLASYAKPEGLVTVATFAPDGQTIYATFHDGKVRAFGPNLNELKVIDVEQSGSADAISVAPYERRFAWTRVGAESAVCTWTTPNTLLRNPERSMVTFASVPGRVAYLKDSTMIVANGDDAPLASFALPAETGPVTSVSFDAKATRLLVVSRDPKPAVTVYDLTTKAPIASWASAGPAAFALEDTVLLRENNRLVRRKPGVAEPVAKFDVNPAGFAVSLDGRVAVVDDYRARFRVFDLVEGRERRPERSVPRVTALAAGPDNTVTVSTAKETWRWEPRGGGLTSVTTPNRPESKGVLTTSVGPAGLTAHVSPERNLILRNADKDVWSRQITAGPPVALAAGGDGSHIAVATPTRVNVFSVATGDRVWWATRKWEDGPYRTVAISADGRLLAVGSAGTNGSVTVWETATFRLAGRFVAGGGTVEHLAFVGPDRLAVATADDALSLWDVTGRPFDPPAPTDAELTAAWDSLARSADFEGFKLVPVLAAGGDRAVTLIAAGAKALDAQNANITRWVTELNATDFDVRANAATKLTRLGTDAIPALTTATESRSLEVRRRAQLILEGYHRTGETVPITGLIGGELKRVRAVAVLERIGTPAAKQLIADWAKGGGPGAAAARAALAR